jgi:hypothetical protein
MAWRFPKSRSSHTAEVYGQDSALPHLIYQAVTNAKDRNMEYDDGHQEAFLGEQPRTFSGLELDREGPFVIRGNSGVTRESVEILPRKSRSSLLPKRYCRTTLLPHNPGPEKEGSPGVVLNAWMLRERMSFFEDGDVIQYAEMHADDSDTIWSGIRLAKWGWNWNRVECRGYSKSQGRRLAYRNLPDSDDYDKYLIRQRQCR